MVINKQDIEDHGGVVARRPFSDYEWGCGMKWVVAWEVAWDDFMTYSGHTLHCKLISIYVFPEKELRGLSPNFHIHAVSVSNLYITGGYK